MEMKKRPQEDCSREKVGGQTEIWKQRATPVVEEGCKQRVVEHSRVESSRVEKSRRSERERERGRREDSVNSSYVHTRVQPHDRNATPPLHLHQPTKLNQPSRPCLSSFFHLFFSSSIPFILHPSSVTLRPIPLFLPLCLSSSCPCQHLHTVGSRIQPCPSVSLPSSSQLTSPTPARLASYLSPSRLSPCIETPHDLPIQAFYFRAPQEQDLPRSQPGRRPSL